MSRNKGPFAVLGGIVAGYATLLALYLYFYSVDAATVLAVSAVFFTMVSAFLILTEERRKRHSADSTHCKSSQRAPTIV